MTMDWHELAKAVQSIENLDRMPSALASTLAYNFKIGDLRGMYALFIPDLQKALKDAVSN